MNGILSAVTSSLFVRRAHAAAARVCWWAAIASASQSAASAAAAHTSASAAEPAVGLSRSFPRHTFVSV